MGRPALADQHSGDVPMVLKILQHLAEQRVGAVLQGAFRHRAEQLGQLGGDVAVGLNLQIHRVLVVVVKGAPVDVRLLGQLGDGDLGDGLFGQQANQRFLQRFLALAHAAVLAAVLETVLVHVQLPLFLLIITHFNDYMFKTYKIIR